MKDLVSVIIPTYNRSQYLIEAVDSVLCQTYPHIELIVVDDGSTDDTEKRIAPYLDKITYIKKENGGVSSAINVGLEIANGKYIARLDDDDLFVPHKTEKQLQIFKEDSEIGMVTSGCFLTDSMKRATSLIEPPDFSDYGPFISLLIQYSLFQPTVMVRRECHERLGGYKHTFGEDCEMFLRIARYWKVGVIQEPLAKCRRHSGNMTKDLLENEVFLEDLSNFTRDILDDVALEELFPPITSVLVPYRRSCAYAAKGALYLRNRITGRAKRVFVKALNLCPDNPIPPLWLGILERDSKNFGLAEEYFSKIEYTGELSPIAQNARDLMIAIRKTGDSTTALFRREILSEFRKLFKVTYNGISGKTIEKSPSWHASMGSGLKPSRYTIIIDNYPRAGEHLVFNLLTQAMVNVGDEVRDFIQNPDYQGGKVDPEDINMMRKMGILVNRNLNEAEMTRKWYDNFRRDMTSMQVTILTTYDCNFACKYCIEEGIKKPVYMDRQCSDALADWLENKVRENDTKQLHLYFYGGEPLLNIEPIFSISRRLNDFSDRHGIVFSSSIITNGSLIDRESLRELVNYGLKSVKVAVDGVKDIHDARRPFRNGRGSFDTIIKNIQNSIPDSVELGVQCNLDEESVSYFPDLLQLFESLGLRERIDDLVVGSVVQLPGPLREGGCIDLFHSNIADQLNQMRRLVVESGFKSKYDAVKYVFCGMSRLGSSLVVDPLGLIWTCPAFVSNDRFVNGSVYSSELNFNLGASETRLERCFQCEYIFVCGGGCRYLAFGLYGDPNRLVCERSFIEDQTREMVKLAYDLKARQKALSFSFYDARLIRSL